MKKVKYSSRERPFVNLKNVKWAIHVFNIYFVVHILIVNYFWALYTNGMACHIHLRKPINYLQWSIQHYRDHTPTYWLFFFFYYCNSCLCFSGSIICIYLVTLRSWLNNFWSSFLFLYLYPHTTVLL